MYFHQLIFKYLSFYVRPDDFIIEINPHGREIINLFDNKKSVVFSNRKSDVDQLKKLNADFFLLNGNVHYEKDVQVFLEGIHRAMNQEQRVIFTYYSSLWKPLVKLASLLGLRKRLPEANWITHDDMKNILNLANFEVVNLTHKIIVPIWIPCVSYVVNRFLAPLPFFSWLTWLNILVARPIFNESKFKKPSVSVIIPARNEAGNIENAIKLIPSMGPRDEIIFIEGNSRDNTWEMIERLKQKYKRIKIIRTAQQDGRGKGDAVRKGFGMAKNEILMILDADLTVRPQDLAKFYNALLENKGEFVNGSRMVYPMEKQAMQFLNMIGNKFFAVAFTYILGQAFKDTLCGTKVLTRSHYLKIAKNRQYFGDFDPFGDFDLIFGAIRLGLKVIEVPVHYHSRKYGSTNIQRWRHGIILIKMLLFSAFRIKFI